MAGRLYCASPLLRRKKNKEPQVVVLTIEMIPSVTGESPFIASSGICNISGTPCCVLMLKSPTLFRIRFWNALSKLQGSTGDELCFTKVNVKCQRSN